jgi:periplasmic protein CpxP/Spy
MINAIPRCGSALFAVFLAIAPGVAHTQAPPPPPPQTSTSPPSSPEAQANQRIQALQEQLHITPAQMPQWNAFAETMRQNAINTDNLFRQRAKQATTMNALDNMKSYAQIARAYADNTEALEKSFEALYGVLSDQQKQTVDTLFREEAQRNAQPQQGNKQG